MFMVLPYVYVYSGSPYLGCCALDNQQGKFLAIAGTAGPDPWMQTWSDFSASHAARGNMPIKLEGQLVVLQVDGSQAHSKHRGGRGGTRSHAFRR
jgi:hypothetical protein